MSKIFALIRSLAHFLNHKLWKFRLNKLDKTQGFFIKQIRIFSIAIKGFNEDKCLLKASALTYYLLFSIVPVVALVFAIAKGFGYEKNIQHVLLEDFSQYRDVLTQVFTYADSMLERTKGGLIAGIGILLLFWTVMKLLGSIEDSFNEIWEIKKGRGLVRKFTDYLSIMLIAPVLIILSGSITVIIKNQVDNVMEQVGILQSLGPLISWALKLSSLVLMTGLFTFLYMVLPNTKIHFKSALIAGFVAGILFEIVEWAYITFQIGAVQYNAIYGSFAALPLFLIWVQYSWFIVLFGAELAFANQNVDHYELENEIQEISIRYKKVLSLLVANLVVKNFMEGKAPYTASQIAQKLDLPIRLARSIIFDFTEAKIFNEVKTQEEKEMAYQPGISDSKLTIKYVIDAIETNGVNEIPIQSSEELKKINELMLEFDTVLSENKGNILVKDIY